MISGFAGLSRTPGKGQFTCCTRDHKMGGEDIPCDRPSIGSVTWQTLDSKIADLVGCGELDASRLWRSYTGHFMQGLSCAEMTATVPAVSVDEFLHQYSMRADEASGSPSGITALLLAVSAGNAAVVNALARRTPADVRVQVKTNFRALGVIAGATPLHAAVAVCPSNHIAIITSLLEHGADPNAGDTPPLFHAADSNNMPGLDAIISCAGARLDIEKRNSLPSVFGHRTGRSRLLRVITSDRRRAVGRWSEPQRTISEVQS